MRGSYIALPARMAAIVKSAADPLEVLDAVDDEGE